LPCAYCKPCICWMYVSGSLIRTFMFLGFVIVAPGTHQLAVSGDLMYLAYSVEPDDSSSSDDDSSDSSWTLLFILPWPPSSVLTGWTFVFYACRIYEWQTKEGGDCYDEVLFRDVAMTPTNTELICIDYPLLCDSSRLFDVKILKSIDANVVIFLVVKCRNGIFVSYRDESLAGMFDTYSLTLLLNYY